MASTVCKCPLLPVRPWVHQGHGGRDWIRRWWGQESAARSRGRNPPVPLLQVRRLRLRKVKSFAPSQPLEKVARS